MCGIAGYVGSSVDGLLVRMIGSITHRFVSSPVDFRHARLAVIDHTSGAQPMLSVGGRLVIVCNGEIYN
jgi:asparagine synthase (glutamine-hydrolysing)